MNNLLDKFFDCEVLFVDGSIYASYNHNLSSIFDFILSICVPHREIVEINISDKEKEE